MTTNWHHDGAQERGEVHPINQPRPPSAARLFPGLGATRMWPFEWLDQRKYQLRHKAALIVLLGQYLQNDLQPEDRERIEAEVDANFKRESWPPSLERHWLRDSEYMAAYRASAMDRLGIEPRIPPITWAKLFRPWSFWRSRSLWPIDTKADLRAPYVVQYFYPMNKATADARALLRRRGMQIPDFDPWDRYPFPDAARGAPNPSPHERTGNTRRTMS